MDIRAFGSKMVSNIDSAYQDSAKNKHNNYETTYDHVDIGSQSIVEEITMTNLNFSASVIDEYDIDSSPISEKANRYSIEYDYRLLILPPVAPCKYCGAFKFYKETERFCYSTGEIHLVEIKLPEYIVHLIT
ncbi:hypothetical protein LIER_16523 [Lithospermum erythrorhizon]|uniref:Uncharacterized protein n=1 Tax=Lithospermum erythrorhizon TaxID=34254 RepID=A0AAV3Q9H3_LITER